MRKVGGWIATSIFTAWAIIKYVLDWVGRSTYMDDWGQLLDEKLPIIFNWLYSTPAWVPAILAATLTIFMIWANWPRRYNENHGASVHPIIGDLTETDDLELVAGELIQDCSVVADGKHFRRYEFKNVTIVYNGDRVGFEDCKFHPAPSQIYFHTDNQRIVNYMEIMKKIGVLANVKLFSMPDPRPKKSEDPEHR